MTDIKARYQKKVDQACTVCNQIAQESGDNLDGIKQAVTAKAQEILKAEEEEPAADEEPAPKEDPIKNAASFVKDRKSNGDPSAQADNKYGAH